MTHARESAIHNLICTEQEDIRLSHQKESPNSETYIFSKQWKTASNAQLIAHSPQVSAHVDITGSMSGSSFDANRYCLVMVKTGHRYERVDLLRCRKSAGGSYTSTLHESIRTPGKR